MWTNERKHNVAMKQWILMRWSIHQSATVLRSFKFAEMIYSNLWILLCICSIYNTGNHISVLLMRGKQALHYFPFHPDCYSVRASQWLQQTSVYAPTSYTNCYDWGHNRFIAWGHTAEPFPLQSEWLWDKDAAVPSLQPAGDLLTHPGCLPDLKLLSPPTEHSGIVLPYSLSTQSANKDLVNAFRAYIKSISKVK